MKTLDDLFEHQLQDLYSAEEQLIKALPEMAAKASNPKLKKAFESHLEETKEQKRLLEEVCKELDIKPSGEKCKAMEGLIQEAKSMMKEKASPEVMDAALIADAQRIEHYEISGYGTACTFAKQLDHSEAKKKLGKILEQEYSADEKLTKISETVNAKAEA
ncbi:MAG: ferritin-like domain-containing protein [Cyclobacteriaceae bacterium]|nr:ferritin-like domain-containing protein [Cyclobacteriaceae bacterium]